jgi:hypothetical protein
MTDINEAQDHEMKAQVAAWYRDAAPDPGARATAMQRLIAEVDAPVRRHRRRGWAWAALPIAVAAAAVLAVALIPRRQPPEPVTANGERRSAVNFEVSLPGRHPQTVTLAGDFNGWSPRGLEMVREGSSDRWRITIQLPPGRHVYSFVVDGTTWVIDPVAPRIDTDDLGPANVMAVGQAGD